MLVAESECASVQLACQCRSSVDEAGGLKPRCGGPREALSVPAIALPLPFALWCRQPAHLALTTHTHTQR